MLHSIWNSMFHLQMPLLEKVLRPAVVYLCLVLFLRVFGKRELAQLNPFDLVVLLSLSNTVQNAIIGNDNSVTGGIVGALTLLTVNWLLTRVLFTHPRLTERIEGDATTLVLNGVVDEKALKREALTHVELISVLNKNGFNDPADVLRCVLEPNGTFYVEGVSPSSADKQSQQLLEEVKRLGDEMKALRAELAARN